MHISPDSYALCMHGFMRGVKCVWHHGGWIDTPLVVRYVLHDKFQAQQTMKVLPLLVLGSGLALPTFLVVHWSILSSMLLHDWFVGFDFENSVSPQQLRDGQVDVEISFLFF